MLEFENLKILKIVHRKRFQTQLGRRNNMKMRALQERLTRQAMN